MKYRGIEKLMVVMVVAMSVIWAWASPWTAPVKAAVEASEKVIVRTGSHAVGEAAVRGGTALAAATARHEAAKTAARVTVGKAVEKATPGRILAVGGGTALVVGAHEVADGVQTMCESVGKAVEDNPEAAVSLGHEILSIPKTITILATMFVIAVLMWLLWPFISLVRNWIRLVSVRKARALAAVPVENYQKPDSENIGKSGFARISLVWIVAFLLLTALSIWSLAVDGSILRAVRIAFLSPEDKSRVEHRAKVVAELRKKYADDTDRIYRDFLAEVDATAQVEFGHVRSCIPDVVEKFGTLSRCATLVKTIILDKWKGENRTEESVKQDLEATYYNGLYAARDRMAECIQRLATNLGRSRRDFAARLKEELSSVELPGDDCYKELLTDCDERIEKSKYDLAVGQLVAGVSVAMEAICGRQTVKVASCLLGKAAARQAGTMAASAGAAVADGPLPVGDIIGVVATIGCTAWTGLDVYRATKILPAKLAETLTDATADCERQCRKDALQAGEKVFERFSLSK